jgi:copper chaperone CopZ
MQTNPRESSPGTTIRDTSLHVTGMRCGSCKRRVDAALARVPGVSRVRVDVSGQRVDIQHASGTTIAALVQAITAEGYGARLTEPE